MSRPMSNISLPTSYSLFSTSDISTSYSLRLICPMLTSYSLYPTLYTIIILPLLVIRGIPAFLYTSRPTYILAHL